MISRSPVREHCRTVGKLTRERILEATIYRNNGCKIPVVTKFQSHPVTVTLFSGRMNFATMTLGRAPTLPPPRGLVASRDWMR